MTAPALSLVPMDRRPQPEQLLLRSLLDTPSYLLGVELREPPGCRRFLRAHLRQAPAAAPAARAWRNPLRVRTPVEGAGDLLAYQAPARRGPKRAAPARPKRAPARQVPPRAVPVRPKGLQVWAPRKLRSGARPRSLGTTPLTGAEREQLERDEAWLRRRGILQARPRGEGNADCENIASADPCPFLACRQHLGKEVDENTGIMKLNFPDREIWELPATCAIRVAREYPEGLSLEEVGKRINLTQERVSQIEDSGKDKLKRWAKGKRRD